MENESVIQLNLRRNRVQLLGINYPVIASHLIAKGHLTEVKHEEIKLCSKDGSGRMDDLISYLYKLNSMDAYEVFIQGLTHSGERKLADDMKINCENETVMVEKNKTGMEIERKPWFQIPNILKNIFENFTLQGLKNARLVCSGWNQVVVESFVSNKFDITFKDVTQMKDFIETGQNSTFCKALRKFTFANRKHESSDNPLYQEFFQKFGPMKSLTLAHYLTPKLIANFEEGKIYLQTLDTLVLQASILNSCNMPDDSLLACLPNLQHLVIVGYAPNGPPGPDELRLTKKLLQRNHKLKSLYLQGHYCAGLAEEAYPNLFKTSTLEVLCIDEGESNCCFRMQNDYIVSMTVKGKSSKLRDLTIALDSNVSPKAFHQFLVSHRLSLQRLTLKLQYASKQLMEDFPQMDKLDYCELKSLDQSSDLSFCTQAENLKELRLPGYSFDRTNTFQHFGLRSLVLKFTEYNPKETPEGIVKILRRFVKWFPNLTKIVVSHLVSMPLTSISNLQQASEPGKTTWSLPTGTE